MILNRLLSGGLVVAGATSIFLYLQLDATKANLELAEDREQILRDELAVKRVEISTMEETIRIQAETNEALRQQAAKYADLRLALVTGDPEALMDASGSLGAALRLLQTVKGCQPPELAKGGK